MPFIVIVGAIFAWWIYRDAKRWGYGSNTALLWAFGSVVAPYVTVPVYFLFGRRFRIGVRSPQQEPAAELVLAADTVDCPMCGGKAPADAGACPRCGYSLQFICSGCGRELQREWKVCPYCQEKAPEK